MVVRIIGPMIAAFCALLALASSCPAAGTGSWRNGLVAASPGVLAAADKGGADVVADRPDAAPAQSQSGGAMPAGFGTKYAYFEPARFSDLPGWHDDDLADAWKAFRGSCAALASRSAWSLMCQRATDVRIRNDEIRRFFEQEFVLYQIHNRDRSPAGIITGYYEPLLNGSRRRMGKYVYPVYGVPGDLLYLDSRSLSPSGAGGPYYARVEGRLVIPDTRSWAPGATRDDVRILDVGGAKPDIRDKKLRVRVDGDRIVPYYTRGQIEQGALDPAQVIVWVDSVAALYSMQVQGSGKVRLPDGTIIRLAYAEQNGHPFLPPVQTSSRPGQASVPIPQTRGIPLRAWLAGDQATANGAGQIDLPAAPATRGARNKAGAGGNQGKNAASDGEAQEMSSEVARVVDLLLKSAGSKDPVQDAKSAGTKATAQEAKSVATKAAVQDAKGAGTKAAVQDAKSAGTKAPPHDAPAATASPRKPSSTVDSNPVQAADTVTGSPSPALLGMTVYSSDPSYVFFRQVPDNVAGPIGALGVPLTAGRSIAVDPRTTPLGFPVFVASKETGGAGGFNRLMIAQDTGGAIRGAVRADYFWGFGPGAGERAGRMKQVGEMWLLLPKDQQLSAKILEPGTRGAGGAECVVPDPDLCVE